MKEQYRVKVNIDFNHVYLSVSHNKWQWASIPIKNPEKEIPLIIDALNLALKKGLPTRDEPIPTTAG